MLLDGEMTLYKRPQSLYSDTGKMTECSKVPNFQNPKDSGNQHIGVKTSTIKAKNLVGEDAFVFKQPNIYTMKAD